MLNCFMIADKFSLKNKEIINAQFIKQQATSLLESKYYSYYSASYLAVYPKIAVKCLWICYNRKLNLNYSAENVAIAVSAKI